MLISPGHIVIHMADSTAPVRRTAEQPAAGFNPYGWTKTRTKWAKLDYRWDSKSQWQSLDDSYIYAGKDDMTEPWNVEQVDISGEGITVNQFGGPYSRKNDAKTAPVTETRYCWQVKFEYGKFDSVVISERERRNPGEKAEKLPLFVQIQFKCLALPTSHDATVHKSPTMSAEAGSEDGEADEAGVDEAEAEGEAGNGEAEVSPHAHTRISIVSTYDNAPLVNRDLNTMLRS